MPTFPQSSSMMALAVLMKPFKNLDLIKELSPSMLFTLITLKQMTPTRTLLKRQWKMECGLLSQTVDLIANSGP